MRAMKAKELLEKMEEGMPIRLFVGYDKKRRTFKQFIDVEKYERRINVVSGTDCQHKPIHFCLDGQYVNRIVSCLDGTKGVFVELADAYNLD